MVDAVQYFWQSMAQPCTMALHGARPYNCQTPPGLRVQALEAYPMIDAPPSPGVEPDAAPQWSDKPSKGSAGAMHVHAYAPAVAHRLKSGEPTFIPLGWSDCTHVYRRFKGRAHRQCRCYH